MNVVTNVPTIQIADLYRIFNDWGVELFNANRTTCTVEEFSELLMRLGRLNGVENTGVSPFPGSPSEQARLLGKVLGLVASGTVKMLQVITLERDGGIHSFTSGVFSTIERIGAIEWGKAVALNKLDIGPNSDRLLL